MKKSIKGKTPRLIKICFRHNFRKTSKNKLPICPKCNSPTPSELREKIKEVIKNIRPFANDDEAWEVFTLDAIDKLLSSLQQELIRALPKTDIPRVGSENADRYRDFANGFNSAIDTVKQTIINIFR